MSVLFANVFLSTTLRVLWLEQKPFSSAFPCLCSCIQSGQSNLSRFRSYMNGGTEIPLTGFLISQAYSVFFFVQSKLFWMGAIPITIDPKSFITSIKFPTTGPWITMLMPQLLHHYMVRAVNCVNNIYEPYLELSNIASVA